MAYAARLMIDWALSRLLRSTINSAMEQYEVGSITDARVVWKAREIHLDVMLEGEATSVQLQASQVEFLQMGDDVFVSVGEVKCSRIWIEKAVKKMQPNVRAKLPIKAAKALKLAGVVKAEQAPLLATDAD